ncbi:acyltransferase family protein [Algimonas porphyrae]|uniref:Acyltransferase n=1 Tax=Algimonas porphyrae TaxID=1128113 RepID=A0ABQ5UWC1_9PROT|nr:acyltransferase [Algimonas porphyrae]GLQ19571.1 acyltransferase [Algimonas porphyrae]
MTIEAPPQTRTLLSIQALRGVAALLVVLFHSAEIWRDMSGGAGLDGLWDRGWAGVDLFFVISGFVMVWVAGERASGLRSAGRFLFDRATRVYPLWWVFCALMGLYFWVTYGQPATPVIYDAQTAWGQFFASMALWPTEVQPVLTVGWTLTFELAFYAVFALLLLLPSRFRMGAILIWGLGLALIWLLRPDSPALPDSWLGVVMSPLCLEFVFGALVAWLVQRFSIPRSVGLTLFYLGAMGFLGLMIAGETVGGLPDIDSRVATFGLAAAVLLCGVVTVERNGGIVVLPALRAIGDASYTLYLSHLLVILALKRVCEAAGILTAPSLSGMAVFMALATSASLIAALILYRLLEKPLLTLSRALLPKRRDMT